MKVEMLSNTIIVYLLDNKKYNEDSDIKKILINVFDNLEKYYNITFTSDYNLELYINRYYGMILEIKENEDFIYDDIVNLKLNILRDTLFLYEVDDPLEYINYEIYYYNDKFYVNAKREDINLMENSNLVYGDIVYKIIGRGIKI
ncbi:unknown [Clostridium sp. CAG:433]|nr:MAG: hypothetical protein BHW07_02960 [Clostridium sp. CAG_433_25_7]CDD29300.1 unknown [Clostridium sp. CAG:433]